MTIVVYCLFGYVILVTALCCAHAWCTHGLVKCSCHSVSHPVEPTSSVSIETPHLATSWGMATRTTIGQIQEFHPDSESFAVYVERVELFFTTNDIPAEKKVPVFLSVVGGYYVRVVA